MKHVSIIGKLFGSRERRPRPSISAPSASGRKPGLAQIEQLEERLVLSSPPLTQTFSFTFPDGKTNQSMVGTLPKFDPGLGQLTSIDLTVSGHMTADIKVENDDPSPVTITGTYSGTWNLSGPDLANQQLTFTPMTRTFPAAAFDGKDDFAGTSGKDLGAVTVSTPASSSPTLTLTSAQALADYSGSGNLIFTESTTPTSSVSGGGNLTASVQSTAGGSISVTYHYVPASISGFVYLDVNDNGQDDSEPGLGATVTLTGTNDLGQAVSLTTTSSGTAGAYSFINLRPSYSSGYTISASTVPGYADGKVNAAGSLGGTPGNDVFSNVLVPSGANGVNYNFGKVDADTWITKTVNVNTLVAPGSPVVYTLTVGNNGQTAANDVVVSDTLPAGETPTNIVGQNWYISVNLANNTFTATWVGGTVAAGTTLPVITVSANAPVTGGTFVNTATVTSSTPGDNTPGDNTAQASITVALPDVYITKSVNLSTVGPGNPVAYTITVGNKGQVAANG
ncbi:MAG: choice-of-anchor E domain-containing protein, partial [Planctomycetes bacterium]|nr:choice-of-anchor E domain-containing protein [Planctomycetota bacterium]